MNNSADIEGRLRGGKGREAFRTISEVADDLELPQHVLRFWESKFSQIRPLKRGGNRRYYRPDDVQLLSAIKKLLHADGYTIRGVQQLFKAQGLKATVAQAIGEVSEDEGLAAGYEDDAIATMPDHADTDTAGVSEVSRDGLVSVLARLKALRASIS